MTKALDSEEYVDNLGAECPWIGCNSSNINAQEPLRQVGDGKADQMMECYDCGAEWNDVYLLHKAEDITDD